MGVALLVVVLGLTACSGEGSADPEDPTDPSSVEVTVNADDQASGTYTADPLAAQTPTGDAPEPSPYPKPERPAEMDDHGEKGAIAAAKYFFELYNYVQATGETEPLDSLIGPQCDSCRALIHGVQEIYEGAGYMEGGGLSMVGPKANPTIDGLGWEVAFEMEIDALSVVNSDNDHTQYEPSLRHNARIGVARIDSEWEIIEIRTGQR